MPNEISYEKLKARLERKRFFDRERKRIIRARAKATGVNAQPPARAGQVDEDFDDLDAHNEGSPIYDGPDEQW